MAVPAECNVSEVDQKPIKIQASIIPVVAAALGLKVNDSDRLLEGIHVLK